MRENILPAEVIGNVPKKTKRNYVVIKQIDYLKKEKEK